MLIGAQLGLESVLVEVVSCGRQKDKLWMHDRRRKGARHKAVRVEVGESGRAIGASCADATREGGDIRMSSSSQSNSTIFPPANHLDIRHVFD